MLQRSVINVSSMFPDACCKCVYLDIAYVSHIRSMCFIWMLHMVIMVFKCFHVFLSVLGACFKCFICLQTYVTTVVFGCYKSRSDVASLLLAFCCITLVCPTPGVGKTSIRRHVQVLPNRRHRPHPLLSFGWHRSRMERMKRSAARGVWTSSGC
jgi:hypothetical protein